MKRILFRGSLLLGIVICAASAQAADIIVPAGGNLQAALDQAQPGDRVILQAGGRYVGQFKFPAKAGTVTLTSSGPLPDRRISPADAAMMATVASGLTTMAFDLYDAKNWIIDGIRFEGNVSGYGEIVGLWRAENIVLRRLLIDIPDPQEQKRFILGNGRNITLAQSYCSGIWRSGQDSQCFVAWDGAGPYTIRDNFLEAASENVMFGGADSLSPDNIPADILVEDNLFSKRLAWKGQKRGVKNIFELKAARRVVVRNNVFERNWVDAQSGTAIVFTPRNQSGTAPWTVVEDVLFEYNIVRDTPSHFNILGYDNAAPSGQTTGITIRHNLLIGSGGGRLATIGNEVGTLVLDHNTYISPQTSSTSMISLYAEGAIAVAGGSRTASFAVQHFTFTNHMAQFNTYGLHSSLGMGTAGLTKMTLGYQWQNNLLAGGAGTYPATTTFLAAGSYPEQFDAEYFLAYTSPYKSMATDGTDLGWNRRPADPGQPSPPAQVSITTASLPAGRTSQAYSASVGATGGSGSYTWTLHSGALPAGLTLDLTTASISGTPASAGVSTFVLRAADLADTGNYALAGYTVTVTTQVTLAGGTLASGQVSKAYNATPAASGGSGTYAWAVSHGSLPSGLALNAATGAIGGTPTVAGTSSFTLRATDASDGTNIGSASYSMTIDAAPVTITPVAIMTGSLPAARAGVGYSATLTASGGGGTYAWAVTAGALPAGLALDMSTGAISGTPASTGSSTFTVRAADAANAANYTVATYTLTVSPALTITTSALPAPRRNTAYSATLAAANASGSVTWRVTAGALPGGLSLNTTTGVISGTARGNGSSTFTVTVTDAGMSAARSFTLTIAR